MSTKPTKHAQSAAEHTEGSGKNEKAISNSANITIGNSSANPSPVAVELSNENPSEKPEETGSNVPLLFNLGQFDKTKLALAEEMGIPVKLIAETMNKWAASVEERFQIVAEGINKNPERTIQLLQKAAQESQARAIQQERQAPQSEGGGEGEIGTLLALLSKFGGGGSSDDGFSAEIKAGMIKNAVESMNSDAAMGRAIKEHVVASLAQKVAKKITEDVLT